MQTTNELNVINVHIGEVKLGNSHSVLKAILGSCVGIGVIWRAKGKTALAHCLLPYGDDDTKPGKFVDQAIESLIKALEVSPSEYKELEIVLAGGASMYEETAKSPIKVGLMNSEAAIKCLGIKNLKVIYQDLGRTYGRQLILNGHNGDYQVRTLEGFKKD